MKKKKERQKSFINRKARFQYEFLETLTAGISLQGTEIKSIREGGVSFVDAFCMFNKHELFVRNMHIAIYEHGNIYNHEPKRDRKLLLSKRELRKWKEKVSEKGLTIIPAKLFINNKGYAKLEIALAKGKQEQDKREDIKRRDMEREMNNLDNN